jgi:outer membrane beta-barrel protein
MARCRLRRAGAAALLAAALAAFSIVPAAGEEPATAAPAAPGDASAAAAAPAAPASAAPPPATPGAGASAPASGTGAADKQQVIEPQVARREFKKPRFPSDDIELGIFTGTYETQNFGSSLVAGVRAGYHISEDVFVEAAGAQTRVTDQDFRQILPGGIFPLPRETLRYYNLSLGYNILPGEIFLPGNHAKYSALYVIAGVGTTNFDQNSRETINVGAGFRVFLADWTAVQLDVRDHVFSINLLGAPQTTQNLEFTLGLSFFF